MPWLPDVPPDALLLFPFLVWSATRGTADSWSSTPWDFKFLELPFNFYAGLLITFIISRSPVTSSFKNPKNLYMSPVFVSWPLCSPIFGLHCSNKSRLCRPPCAASPTGIWQWPLLSLSFSLSDLLDTLAPPAWAIFVHQAPQCSWVAVTVVTRCNENEWSWSLRRPCLGPWAWKRRWRCASDKPAAVTPSLTHARTCAIPKHWMTPFFLPFFPPKGDHDFYIPAFLLYSCTVKQSLPFFSILSVECVKTKKQKQVQHAVTHWNQPDQFMTQTGFRSSAGLTKPHGKFC